MSEGPVPEQPIEPPEELEPAATTDPVPVPTVPAEEEELVPAKEIEEMVKAKPKPKKAEPEPPEPPKPPTPPRVTTQPPSWLWWTAFALVVTGTVFAVLYTWQQAKRKERRDEAAGGSPGQP